MARRPSPWFWEARNCWYVQFKKKQVRLDPDEETAWRLYGRLLASNGLLTREQAAQMTVPEAVDFYIDEEMRPGRQESTRLKSKRNLKPFAKAFKDRTLASITQTDVLAYCGKPEKWSDGYRHAIFAEIMTLTRWCRDRGYLESNPLAGCKNPWPPSRREGVITAEQFGQLLAVIPDAEFRLLLRVLFYTGCRPGEAYKLKPRHLHQIESKAVLTHKEHKTGHRTGKKRVIVFPVGLMTELRQLAALRGPDEPVLVNTQGKPWNGSTVKLRFERALKRAGLPSELVVYNLRHSFITQLVHQGELTPLVALQVGHNGDQMIQQVYLHAEAKALAEIVERRAASEPNREAEDKLAQLQEEVRRLREQLANQDESRRLLEMLKQHAEKLSPGGGSI